MTLRARRAAFAARAGALLALAFALAATLVWAADRRPTRWDATGGGESSLTPRLRHALETLDSPARITVVAPSGTVGARERRRIEDMLDTVRRDSAAAGGRVTTTWLDPSQPADGERFDAMIAGWAQASAREFEAQRDAISGAMEEFESLAGLAPAPIRAPAMEAAHRARAVSEDSVGETRIPAPDVALEALAPALNALRTEWSREAGAPREDTRGRLERIAKVEDGLRQAARLQSDALRATRAMLQGPTMVVEARVGAMAIGLGALFLPAREAGREAEFVGQEALATALARGQTEGALIALVHAGAPLLDDATSGMGAPATPEAREFVGRLIERLRLGGSGVVEWAVAQQRERPRFSGASGGAGATRGTSGASAGGDGARPVVWVIIAPAAITPGAGGGAAALASALNTLVEDGESALVALEPSALPGLGERDPLIAPLAPMGIDADTGRVIFEAGGAGRARAATPEFRVAGASAPSITTGSGSDAHPAARAAAELPLLLAWASEVRARADATSGATGAVVTPLVTIPDTASRWAESQWVAFRQTPPRLRAGLAQQPTCTEGMDAPAPSSGGAWVVGVASERRAPAGTPAAERGRAQRMVVVAASGWFLDPVAEATEMVDGRSVALHPGNAALFDASIAWLAGREDAIEAQGRRMHPRIRAMDARTLGALRWAVALGPASALLLIAWAVRRLRRS